MQVFLHVALFSGFPRAVQRAGQLCALSAGQAWKIGGFAVDRSVIAELCSFLKRFKKFNLTMQPKDSMIYLRTRI
jgi:hypothetical protein